MTGGKYIVIEGHDGTGKSTQVTAIRAKLLEHGIESVEFHEPDGTPIADEIRTLIKNGALDRDGTTNLLLFNASRHDIWTKKALPALNEGKWVVASRNYFSTLAYQGYGEGANIDDILTITLIATDEHYMNPDIAVILDLDDENERKKRIGNRGELANPDTFESKDSAFQSRVKDAYVTIAAERNIPVISASQPIDDVTKDIWAVIKPSIQK